MLFGHWVIAFVGFLMKFLLSWKSNHCFELWSAMAIASQYCYYQFKR